MFDIIDGKVEPFQFNQRYGVKDEPFQFNQNFTDDAIEEEFTQPSQRDLKPLSSNGYM